MKRLNKFFWRIFYLFVCILPINGTNTVWAQGGGNISISPQNLYLTVPRNAVTNQLITIVNTDSLPVKVRVFFDTGRTYHAKDTKLSLSADTVIVPANGSVDVTLSFTMPAHADFAYATVA